MNGLSKANVFSGFLKDRTIVYQEAVTAKLLRFEIAHETIQPLYLAAVISRDEKMAWQSFQDLLDHAAGLAQADMQGIFGLDILTVDIQAGIRGFNLRDFIRLLINHSKNLNSELKSLFRYGQLFALLHKRAPADWGKIEVKTHVEIIDPEKVHLETHFKKMIKESNQAAGALYLIHDMSVQSLWDPATPVAGELFLFHSSMESAQRMTAKG